MASTVLQMASTSISIIGGADGPTAIFTTTISPVIKIFIVGALIGVFAGLAWTYVKRKKKP